MTETFDEILKYQTDYYIGKETNIEEIFGEDSNYADLFEFVENNADDPEIVNVNKRNRFIYTYIYRHKESGRYAHVQDEVEFDDMDFSYSEIISIREVKKEIKVVEQERWV